MNVTKKLWAELSNPREFFNSVRSESWKPCLVFYAYVTLVISVVTPILNWLGLESTDFSSSYQAQIIAYNYAKSNLATAYGGYAYLVEAVMIFTLSLVILGFLTLFLHVIYRLIGGTGSIFNAWKAACYGVGPCLLGGFLPYVSLFVAFYSFAMQFYMGPLTLYKVNEGRAIAVFVFFIAATFIEMFTLGTTVGL
jgi:hypothetical protein